jgi:hypothetical protein
MAILWSLLIFADATSRRGALHGRPVERLKPICWSPELVREVRGRARSWECACPIRELSATLSSARSMTRRALCLT